MNILFCVEFYYPSVGGAQEVVRQLAERLAARGHGVTVATSKVAGRRLPGNGGVTVAEFDVAGNLVRGLTGEVDRYRYFLASHAFDVVLFYAAQQWTFDAAWLVIDDVSARKIFVPCGYSALFNPAYKGYFEELPNVLRRMDAVIYHAEEYRDVRFSRSLGLTNGHLIPNGADGEEFLVDQDPEFRQRIGARGRDFVVLTVGTITGLKGHLELVNAVAQVDCRNSDRRLLLILNGNQPEISGRRPNLVQHFAHLVKSSGYSYALKHTAKSLLRRCGVSVGRTSSIQDVAQRINREQAGRKRVVLVDLPRSELIQAYLNSDLFVFASNVEYSPLVLFEACAAGLPFITVPVGNAEEIAAWTGGGEVCPAAVDAQGYTRVAPAALARHIESLVSNSPRRAELGRQGREASLRRYNWAVIAGEYERLMAGLVGGHCSGGLSEKGDLAR